MRAAVELFPGCGPYLTTECASKYTVGGALIDGLSPVTESEVFG